MKDAIAIATVTTIAALAMLAIIATYQPPAPCHSIATLKASGVQAITSIGCAPGTYRAAP